MKRLQYLFIAITFGATSFAQKNDTTVVTHSVNIEKDFTPQIMKVKRTDIDLPTTEPEIPKTEVVYGEETKPIETTTPFNPLQQSDLKIMKRNQYKDGFARIGFGIPIQWMAELWYPIKSNSDYFDIHLKHYGVHIKDNKQLLDTKLDFTYKKDFQQNQLYTTAGISNEYFNYYGIDSIFIGEDYNINDSKVIGDSLLPTLQSITESDITIGLKSIGNSVTWNYDGNINYHLLATTARLKEHAISLNLTAGYNLDNGNLLKTDLNATVYAYNLPTLSALLLDSTWKTQALITLSPRYERSYRNLAIKVGAKIWFSINKDRAVSIAPDVELRYTIAKIFNIYGGVTGDYKFTSMSQILNENRYFDISSQLEKNDYTPFNFFAGFNLKPVHGLVFDGYISYQMIYNTHFFYNKQFDCLETPNQWPDKKDSERVYGNVFTVDYARATLFTAEARLAYNLKDRYNAHIQAKYNGWDVLTENIQAWNKPTWEINTGIDARITKNLAINSSFYYASQRIVKLPNTDGSLSKRTLNPIYDLNFSASYTFNKNWSLFVEANNVLSLSKKLRYEEWYGYKSIGTNILFGASIAF